MTSHIQNKISVKELAEIVNLSTSRYSHLFKEETGMSPMAYFQKEKIENAKQMLNDSKFSIYEISTILGFSNESHFIKVFRKETCMTPGEYRKK